VNEMSLQVGHGAGRSLEPKRKRLLSAGLGANLNFGTMRQLVNEMSLEVGHGAGQSLEPKRKGCFLQDLVVT
jgi:hypothetical protein